MTLATAFKYIWASPASAMGLCVACFALITRGKFQIIDGVIEVSGGAVQWLLSNCVPIPGGAMAMTLGHVVIGQSEAALAVTRPHERVHVRQAERWGPLFIPAYLLGSAWQWLRGRDAYRDNPFERQARDEL